MITPIKLSENLKNAAAKKGVTMKQVLADSGVNNNFIAMMKKRDGYPKLDTLLKICERLNVSILEVLDIQPCNLPLDQQAVLETYLACDEQAKTDILNYIEYQAEQSKRRSEIADNAINQNKRFGE